MIIELNTPGILGGNGHILEFWSGIWDVNW